MEVHLLEAIFADAVGFDDGVADVAGVGAVVGVAVGDLVVIAVSWPAGSPWLGVEQLTQPTLWREFDQILTMMVGDLVMIVGDWLVPLAGLAGPRAIGMANWLGMVGTSRHNSYLGKNM